MGANATSRSAPPGEHQKARYRLLVFGLLALFGPPAFGVPVGLFSAVYSAALVLYALWALRLTVVFPDDAGLGYLLTLFDVVMTLPLIVWGSGTWLAAPMALLWVLGLSVSAASLRRRRLERIDQGSSLVDPITGFMNRAYFPGAVDAEGARGEAARRPLALVTVRVLRLGDLAAYSGPDAADRALACVARRAARELGDGCQGFRLADDRLGLLVPDCDRLEATEHALALARSLRTRLIDGRRVDCAVGYAVAPRDGADAAELLAAADRSLLPPAALVPETVPVRPVAAHLDTTSLSGARVAVG